MRTIIMASAILIAAAVAAPAQLAEGDQHWALRAEGHQSGHAQAAQIDAAIAAYRRAVAQNPNDLEARWKLLRAIRFKGAYVATTNEEKKQVYGEAKTAGEDALAVVNRELAAKGLREPDKAKANDVANAVRTIPSAAEIYFWDSVNW